MAENFLACVNCHASLVAEGADLKCPQCGAVFVRNQFGFISTTDLGSAITSEDYAHTQKFSGKLVYKNYLKPYLDQEPVKRVLDVGCGIGQTVNALIEDGYDAYGIDLPDLSKFWDRAGNDSQRFFGVDATQLPFPDDHFDAVYSLGVIEHIGTTIGHCTLDDNYQEARQSYADEILRVTKPGGRILIACPNKSFPLDIQHGARDALTSITLTNNIRQFIFEKTGINIHQTWGKYHLLSYAECRKLFCADNRSHAFNPLSLKGYFGFARFKSGFLKPFKALVDFYFDYYPRFLRASFLNPYLLVEIKK